MPAFHLEEDFGEPDGEDEQAATEADASAVDAPAAKDMLLTSLAETEEGRALLPLVEALKPTSCRGLALQLGYDESISAEDLSVLMAKPTQRLLQQAMQSAFRSGRAKVLVRRWLAGLSDDQRPGMRLANPAEEQETRQRPFVQQVLNLFGGDVIDVRINERARETKE